MSDISDNKLEETKLIEGSSEKDDKMKNKDDPSADNDDQNSEEEEEEGLNVSLALWKKNLNQKYLMILMKLPSYSKSYKNIVMS